MTSTDRDALRQQLATHEGVRLFPYVDSVGKITIGIGRNLTDRGITDAEARLFLDADINSAIRDCTGFPWFPDLDPVRQRAIVDLCFNIGLPRLRGFTKMLTAMARSEWDAAAHELLDSRYAEQVGKRARTLAAMLRTGQA
jgi:lysozyme